MTTSLRGKKQVGDLVSVYNHYQQCPDQFLWNQRDPQHQWLQETLFCKMAISVKHYRQNCECGRKGNAFHTAFLSSFCAAACSQAAWWWLFNIAARNEKLPISKAKNIHEGEQKHLQEGGKHSHMINSIDINSFRKKISYHGCICGRRNPILLNVRKRLSGEMFCCDCTRKQTGHIFTAWCCLSEKLLLGHAQQGGSTRESRFNVLGPPWVLHERLRSSPCLQQGTLWVQTLLVTQMEELLYNVL